MRALHFPDFLYETPIFFENSPARTGHRICGGRCLVRCRCRWGLHPIAVDLFLLALAISNAFLHLLFEGHLPRGQFQPPARHPRRIMTSLFFRKFYPTYENSNFWVKTAYFHLSSKILSSGFLPTFVNKISFFQNFAPSDFRNQMPENEAICWRKPRKYWRPRARSEKV